MLSRRSRFEMLLLIAVSITVMAMAWWAGTSFRPDAQASQPSAEQPKAAGHGNVVSLNSQSDRPEILATTINTSARRNLLEDASVDCGPFTRTRDESRGSKGNTQTASAPLKLRVLAGGVPAYPPEVTLCSKEQELSAEHAGDLKACDSYDSTADLAADIDALTNTISYTGDDVFAVGDSIKVGNEWMFVEAVDTAANSMTVLRESLGTIAITDAAGMDIYLLDCPPEALRSILGTMTASSFNWGHR